MLPTPLFRSVVVGVCAILVATGVAFSPIGAAQAEEVIGTELSTGQAAGEVTATPTPTAAPSETLSTIPVPTPREVAEPTATHEPNATPVPVPAETDMPAPTEAPFEGDDVAGAEQAFASAFAAASTSFNPGNIISDYNFYNSWAMTESEIQSFLDAKCSRASCLNDYRVTTPTRTWSFGTCATYQGAANESAARIIFKVQRACGISAKVILVTLQKEQTLVSRTSPSESILRKAMGYGCPDTSDCDVNFYGFFNQVYAAARQLTWYSNPEASMFKKYPTGKTSPVQFHPNAACGSSNVFIQNDATHALYNYTPYQPNAVALSNMWGAQNDGCSSYGNRNFYQMYSDWFGNPTTASSPAVSRLSGDTRYSTAAAISKATYPSSGVPVVYITSGENFPDSLSAAPAAASQGGPILMVTAGSTPIETITELNRLKPKRIVVIGGPQVISDPVFASLRGVQSNIVRIAGSDRFDTSRKIAAAVFPNATKAYLASGLNFPDALSASVAAGAQDIPVLLLDGSQALDAATASAMGKMTSVKLAGGTVSISDSQEASVKSRGITTLRLWGANRFLTSVAINRDAFPTASTMYLASGLAFPDAVAGAAAAGSVGSPLYVTNPGCVSTEIRSDVLNKKINNLVMLGGPASLTDAVAVLATC